MRNKLHISTIDENAPALARSYGLGVEIADFCWAQRIDSGLDANIEAAKEKLCGIESRWFHAPFAEITPCAIDPKVRALTAERYRQSISIAALLGIKRLVVHGGYIPLVYFPEHYVAESIRFWKEFLSAAPDDITVALENVMEPDPSMLIKIADGVDDRRLGLCLDIGHANCGISSAPPIGWIESMAKRLVHVHLHDNTGDRDLHMPLGRGCVPIKEIVEKVVELAPEATFTIENMDAEPSIEWLAEKGFLND